jgi:hypothetical protein
VDATLNRGERYRAFIAANWEALAAVAWRGFLASGRGALQVPEELFIHAPPGEVLLGRVSYFTARRGPVGELVQGYDPEQEIVCTILGRDGATSKSYQLRGPVTPPEAYQRAVETGQRER